MPHKLRESLARLLIDGTGKSLTSRSNGARRENAVDAVESTIYQQAVGGNTLAGIFYLKAHRPIYRDRLNIDIEQLNAKSAREWRSFERILSCLHEQFPH